MNSVSRLVLWGIRGVDCAPTRSSVDDRDVRLFDLHDSDPEFIGPSVGGHSFDSLALVAADQEKNLANGEFLVHLAGDRERPRRTVAQVKADQRSPIPNCCHACKLACGSEVDIHPRILSVSPRDVSGASSSDGLERPVSRPQSLCRTASHRSRRGGVDEALRLPVGLRPVGPAQRSANAPPALTHRGSEPDGLRIDRGTVPGRLSAIASRPVHRGQGGRHGEHGPSRGPSSSCSSHEGCLQSVRRGQPGADAAVRSASIVAVDAAPAREFVEPFRVGAVGAGVGPLASAGSG